MNAYISMIHGQAYNTTWIASHHDTCLWHVRYTQHIYNFLAPNECRSQGWSQLHTLLNDHKHSQTGKSIKVIQNIIIAVWFLIVVQAKIKIMNALRTALNRNTLHRFFIFYSNFLLLECPMHLK